MSIVVAGSIATDHLMTFPGRFTDQLIEGQLTRVSLSFLVDDLQVFKGGVAANIAVALGHLGMRPVIVGAVGEDFDDYRRWLDDHGVDTSHIHVSTTQHTARFLCTTDTDQNQIASFYPGAMGEAGTIDIGRVLEQLPATRLVVISPDDPAAMLRHTRTCRDRNVPFAADPSQQLARLNGAEIRELVDGATYLVTNSYERVLLQEKTGWSPADVLARVGTWVTTFGADGVEISAPGTELRVPAVATSHIADPTGVGDAFRAGFVAGLSCDLSLQRSAEIGCVMATVVLETHGTQEYDFDHTQFLTRMADAYGAAAADEVEHALLSRVGTTTTH